MNIYDAVDSLNKSFIKSFGHVRPKWFFTIGVKEKEKILVVYVHTKKHPTLPEEWEGYKIEVKYIGKVRPAKSKT